MNSDAINRFTTITDSFILVLDSRNSTTKKNGSYNSSVTFDFQDNIRDKSRLNKLRGSILNFSCPNSLYIINEYNNLLSISTINAVTYNILIPLGNYNSRNFISTLLTLLPTGFSITLNNISNKFTISYTTDFTINSNSTVYDVMGFSSGISYTSVAGTLILPFTCNFNGLASFNIAIENLNTGNYDSFNKSPGPIVQSIPIQNGAAQIIYYKTNNYSFQIDYSVDYLDISLKDDLNRFINLNNKDWNMTICFECLVEFDKFQLQNGFFNVLENPYGYSYY